MIHLLSCNQCNIQYVDETTFQLHEIINLHKRAKSGCEYIIKRFKYVCVGASFLVQITEVFPGTWYKNNKVCPVNSKTRLDKGNYLIESLWIFYSYGLNKTKRKDDPNLPVGCLFPYIPRSRQRSSRCRNNVNFNNLKDMETIFDCVHNYITNDIKNAFCNVGTLLNNIRKKYLKILASEILLNLI